MASKQLNDIVVLIRREQATLENRLSVEALRRSADSLYDRLPIPAASFLHEQEVPGLWAFAPGVNKDKIVLYFHGGGYVMYTPIQFRTLTAELSRQTRAAVFALDYRRAPEHRFPAAVEDAEQAYRWLLGRGVAPESIVLAGDSAGGGICIALLLLCKARDLPLPAAAFLISPWLDLTLSAETIRTKANTDPVVSKEALQFFIGQYLGPEQSPQHPLASPLLGKLGNLPPILIHVGSNEVLLDDAVRFAGRAGAAGTNVRLEIWAEMIHEWHLWHTRLPEGAAAVRRAARFLRFHLGVERQDC